MEQSINPYKGRQLLYNLSQSHPDVVKRSAQPVLDHSSSSGGWVKRSELISVINLMTESLFNNVFDQLSVQKYLCQKLRADGDRYLYTVKGSDEGKSEESIIKFFNKLLNGKLSPIGKHELEDSGREYLYELTQTSPKRVSDAAKKLLNQISRMLDEAPRTGSVLNDLTIEQVLRTLNGSSTQLSDHYPRAEKLSEGQCARLRFEIEDFVSSIFSDRPEQQEEVKQYIHKKLRSDGKVRAIQKFLEKLVDGSFVSINQKRENYTEKVTSSSSTSERKAHAVISIDAMKEAIKSRYPIAGFALRRLSEKILEERASMNREIKGKPKDFTAIVRGSFRNSLVSAVQNFSCEICQGDEVKCTEMESYFWDLLRSDRNPEEYIRRGTDYGDENGKKENVVNQLLKIIDELMKVARDDDEVELIPLYNTRQSPPVHREAASSSAAAAYDPNDDDPRDHYHLHSYSDPEAELVDSDPELDFA